MCYRVREHSKIGHVVGCCRARDRLGACHGAAYCQCVGVTAFQKSVRRNFRVRVTVCRDQVRHREDVAAWRDRLGSLRVGASHYRAHHRHYVVAMGAGGFGDHSHHHAHAAADPHHRHEAVRRGWPHHLVVVEVALYHHLRGVDADHHDRRMASSSSLIFRGKHAHRAGFPSTHMFFALTRLCMDSVHVPSNHDGSLILLVQSAEL